MDFLRSAAKRAPEAPAVIGPGDTLGGDPPVWSYVELDRWVNTVARVLLDAGIEPGERVAMRLPPCPEAIVLLHATTRIGAVLVPINAGWTEVEIVRALAVAGRPSLIITTEGEVVPWDGEGPPHALTGLDLPSIPPSGPAVVLLTSGTTGAPRPIPLSHRNLTASAEGAIDRLALRSSDCWLATLSPGHVGGIALLHRAAVVGCAVLTRPRFDPMEVADLMDQGSITHASLVPVMLARLLDARGGRPPPETLRCLLIGGAATPRSLLERALDEGYPIALTYGLTEASSQVATAPPERVRQKPGTVGAPLDGVELRLGRVDQEGIGEILVKGPTVVTGLPIPAGGGEVAPEAVGVDDDGWLHTGDLGRLDDEGDLWVVGRRSDRIVTGGVTVEPAEVEGVVARHPAVKEVVAVGVADPEWGERIRIVVVASDPENPPSLEELLAFTRERLASSKRPRELRIVPSLPRNANGKVDRTRLRADSLPPAGKPDAGLRGKPSAEHR